MGMYDIQAQSLQAHTLQAQAWSVDLWRSQKHDVQAQIRLCNTVLYLVHKKLNKLKEKIKPGNISSSYTVFGLLRFDSVIV